MTKKLRIVMAQLNLLVGDLDGNLQKHLAAAKSARDLYQADLIVFPELSLCGYPPEDLLFRKSFITAIEKTLAHFVAEARGIYCLIGHPAVSEKGLLNACSLIFEGKVLGRYAKQFLPNYAIFDEPRYFVSGSEACVISVQGVPLGIVICEDLWHPEPVKQAVAQGARLIVAPNASPFESDKHARRAKTVAARACENAVPILFVNQFGGQDELIFDGGSMAVDAKGKVCQLAGFNLECLHPVDCEIKEAEVSVASLPFSLPNEDERTYHALVLGVHDYVEKNHFPGVIIGVSGGIDSALTLAIAVDALGPERVTAVFMPSRYTTKLSEEEARAVTQALGLSLKVLDLEPAYKSFLETLAPEFSGKKSDVTEENLQSRCRGVLLMALSNKSGRMVLTTGNRSEMAVGYATIYGDMAGGFSVLKDVPKTLVYRLAAYRNGLSLVIPARTLTRAPTAELAPDQKDEDSLPPYAILDDILALYLDQELGLEEIIAAGFERTVVTRIVRLIARNEYKRRQAAIGVRLNYKSFGKDRRYPITCGFKG